jgi:hypothetical protein
VKKILFFTLASMKKSRCGKESCFLTDLNSMECLQLVFAYLSICLSKIVDHDLKDLALGLVFRQITNHSEARELGTRFILFLYS